MRHAPPLMLVQLPPPTHGAAEMNMLSVSAMRASGANPLVVNFTPPQLIHQVGTFTFAKLVSTAVSWSKVLFYMAAARPTHAYLALPPTGYAFFREIITVTLLKIFGLKVIYHLHGQGINKIIRRHRWMRHIYRYVFRRADVIVLSERLKSDLAYLQDMGRVFVLPNGIRDPVSHIDSATVTSKTPGPPILLFVSNMMESKGPLILLNAAYLLAKHGIQFRLKIVGAWREPVTERFVRARLEQLELQDHVELCGPLHDELKYEAFKNADIFVHPTYNDAFPLVILEAMAFSLPVVSTNEGAIPDMVIHGSNGFISAPRDLPALVTSLKTLLRNGDLARRMGANSRQSFLNSFTDQAYVQRFVDMINGSFGPEVAKR